MKTYPNEWLLWGASAIGCLLATGIGALFVWAGIPADIAFLLTVGAIGASLVGLPWLVAIVASAAIWGRRAARGEES